MSDNPYMDMWRFLREIVAPEDSANVDAYWLAGQNGLHSAELKEAKAELLLEYGPDILLERTPEDLAMLVEVQAVLNRVRWKSEVEYLIEHRLPQQLKERLATSEYEVTARRLADQQMVVLTPRDLTALAVDIPNKQFVGSASSYGEIVIRKHVNNNAASADSPREGNSFEQTDPASEVTRGKPGPKSNRTQAVADQLQGKLQRGESTVEKLTGVSALALSKKYGLRETAMNKARKKAIAQFRANPNTTE